jgi:protein dithiol oxidoreductase (disulfide-forming)
MRMSVRFLLALLLSITAVPWATAAEQQWVEGRNYFLIQPPQPTSVGPGKVEVTEVFSYACPACNQFYPIMNRLQASLPANAVVDYVPASFNASEDWPMFQRAYYTAQALNLINKRTHDAMFDAVWKTGELAVVVSSPQGERLRVPAPTIADAAQFYARETGVNAATFINTSKSFSVDSKIRQADQFVRDCQVDQTPTIVVNGTYRVTGASAGTYDQLVALIQYLVAKASNGG